MRDFFTQQDRARRRSWLLLCYFVAAVTAVVIIAATVVHILFTFDPARLYHSPTPFLLLPSAWNHSELVRTGSLVLLFILGASLYKYRQLRSGGGMMIAELLGGRTIFPDTMDPYERRLLNIVEEMALASGITVPSVYLLDKEPGINAFAAGFRQEDAVLGLTRGAMELLNREELQGVVAHEFSHILNGDMLLNLRLQGLLHGLLSVGLLGRALVRRGWCRVRADETRGGASPLQILLGVLIMGIGYLGLFCGKLIKAAISRQREYLADAAAVQFTRNPFGLAGALKKIGGLRLRSRLQHPLAATISHMTFADGLATALQALSTHPPLAERIRRLDPSFSGEFPVITPSVPGELPAFADGADSGSPTPAPQGFAEDSRLSLRSREEGIISGVSPETVLRSMGHPTMEYMRSARHLIDSLPPGVLKAAREPFGARAVIYGLLLASRREAREIQLEALRNHAEVPLWQECEKIFPQLLALPRNARLPLIDLCLPALQLLSAGQHRTFRANIDRLIKADRKIDLFEYVLSLVLERHLDSRFGAAPPISLLSATIGSLAAEISCVLSLLARLGQQGPAAEQSFGQAAAGFKTQAGKLVYLNPAQCSLEKLDQALKRLARASFAIRGKVLSAGMSCVIHDGRITVAEAELLRAMADALGCPVPPWLRGPRPHRQ